MKLITLSIALVVCFTTVVFASPNVPDDISKALSTADQILIFRLSPHKENGDFHNTQIESHVAISDPAVIQTITSDILQSLSEKANSARCFNPHHGVRVISKSRIYDLVICYECRSYKFYYDSQSGFGTFGGSSALLDEHLLTATEKAEQGAAANP
ncbi:MAG: hypothetical protein KGQ89_08585 [Verrucomicrobia bacterium]|nr:hypothetical protein [Verrucomicrobiota bacterium]